MITEFDIIHIKSLIHKRKSRLRSYINMSSRTDVKSEINQLETDIQSLERILSVIQKN
jgi:hypothetical protein